MVQEKSGKTFCGILHKDIPYATYGDIIVSLDIYAPAISESARVPVLLFLHGGSWIRGDKTTIAKGYKNKLLGVFIEAGYAVVSADYRLAGYGATLREQIVDCRNMINWICKNASLYNLDKDNIGIWGSSAGAHIAMYAAYSASETQASGVPVGTEVGKVAYIIDNFAPVNIPSLLKPHLPYIAEMAVKVFARERYMRRRIMLEALTGYDISDKENICRFCKEYSLDNMEIAAKVPTLILHGTGDKVVPYTHSVKMYDKLKMCGVDAEMYLYEGLDHGFLGYTDTDLDDIACRSLMFARKHTRK